MRFTVHHRGEDDSIDILTQLESWYEGENGRYLIRATREALQESLTMTFGYHILQIGVTRNQPLFEDSPINHRIYAAERPGGRVTLVCAGDELPLESDSVDAVILHHCLEFAENPHRLLREVQRVLTPQGHLLVVGFNPWSVQGINSRLRGFSTGSHWYWQHFVSENRLTDWLHLLGLEVESRTRLHHLPLFGRGRLRRMLQRGNVWCDRRNLPTGSVYLMHAIKQVSGIHRPQRPLQLASRRLIGLAVPKPAATPAPTPATPVHRQGDSAA